MAQKLVQAERDVQASLWEQWAAHKEDLQGVQPEKEAAWRDLEAERAQLQSQQQLEQEELLAQLEIEKEGLSKEIAALQQEREEGLLLAQGKKQQALSLKGSEKTPSEKLSEKLMGTRHSLATISLEMQPWKLDAQSRQEQDWSTVNALMSELRDLQAQLQEAAAAHAQEWELLEAQCKLREGQEGLKVQRQEAGKLWHSLGEGAKEREALRVAVKKIESECINLKCTDEDKEQKLALLEAAQAAVGKEDGELQTGLQEVECSRLEAWRELQELWSHMKMLDSENTRVGRELAELQGRLALG
ncbi:hypothetical protein H8958_013630 [Nasalis larvatus]